MFSNGTEYHIFLEMYCFRCSKYKADKDSIPYRNSCSIEKKILEASFGEDAFPKENVYRVEGQGYVCNKFKDKTETRKHKARKAKQIEGQIKLI